ncbi:MAG: hypothetical protein EHM21_15035 [Chloroflexi bacterium]|nr:MAG: hypothetical protein EHM21_15035 [Chloroflexota bacterium]
MPASFTTEPFEIEIVIAGCLDPRRAGWFEGMTLTSQPDGSTTITGLVTDQAALFAIISRIRDLGMSLVSVNRIEP